MTKPTNELGKYLTIHMACDAIGVDRARTSVVYDLINKAGIEKFKIGPFTFVDANAFYAEAMADGFEVTKQKWPPEVEDVRVAKLYTRRDAAEKLGIHPRTVNTWADTGRIDFVEIAPRKRLYKLTGYEKSTRRVHLASGLDLRITYGRDGDAELVEVVGNVINMAIANEKPPTRSTMTKRGHVVRLDPLGQSPPEPVFEIRFENE